jgi:hypothetical protein
MKDKGNYDKLDGGVVAPQTGLGLAASGQFVAAATNEALSKGEGNPANG